MKSLQVTAGQCTDKGRKKANQDFHGISIPEEPYLSSKGIAVAVADGISSSDVSHIASAASIRGFLEDYLCTSEAWSTKTSVHHILAAVNSWLYAQSQKSHHRFDKDKGYVCTFSAIVLKSTTAHLSHIGDSRIYRLRNSEIELLTEDHRGQTEEGKSYLSRALGARSKLEIDYQAIPLEEGDVFILATDGVFEHVHTDDIIQAVSDQSKDLDAASQHLVELALENGSADNLTVQLVEVTQLPEREVSEIYQQLTELPFPPTLKERMEFDGYTVVKNLHGSSRSHVYLAIDNETEEKVVIKIPSVDLRSNAAYLERFLMEDWIARRINSPYVLKPCQLSRKRNYLYVVMEFLEGQTLTKWMRENPEPDMVTVRGIVEQISKGLFAFHRLEMLHQDIRPDNIIIDSAGAVKIIDFGSTKVAGLEEISTPLEHAAILGTEQYSAPEYFLGERGTAFSDQYSLAAITYQLLTGALPYGLHVAKAKTKTAQNKLSYKSVLHEDREIPAWVDYALKKGLEPNPAKRYEELSEFVYDLSHPNKNYSSKRVIPLVEKNPVLFWQCVSLVSVVINVFLLLKK